MDNVLFPHEKVRDIQIDLMQSIADAIKEKKHLVVHAPTGLGKTAATLAPALTYALENDKTVFFLTSRHTQHKIVVDTLKLIKKKFKKNIPCVDIVGKKWMCPVPGVERLYSHEFSEFCKAQREDMKCEFYANTKEKSLKLTVKAKKLREDLEMLSPMDNESVIRHCEGEQMCPYEISIALGKKARVIIGDYFYIFNESIMNNFFSRTERKLEDCIVIVDEGHNLPNRIRELMTGRLTSIMLSRGIKEAKKHGFSETIGHLQLINSTLIQLAKGMKENDEKMLTKDAFIKLISIKQDYEELIADLEFVSEEILSNQKQSYVGSIAFFLEQWDGEDKGFARILSMMKSFKGPAIQLSYRCLDPSLVSGPLIKRTHSTILMSGTLAPTYMYKDLLGFPQDTLECSFKSPFPSKNQLSLIVPKTTTKFTSRNEKQYQDIATVCAEISNTVPGNTAIFFPSYYLRNCVSTYFTSLSTKTIFEENSRLTKTEKADMLEKFKGYKDTGAVLLGAASGSFGEGIDLPGDMLKCVIIVGLPLQKPDLETKELIAYYDVKFKKGWDYGYLFPAFNTSLQNAGRCIRSKKDKGVIVFLDERYTWPNYYRCFPKDTNIKISQLYENQIKAFFIKNAA